MGTELLRSYRAFRQLAGMLSKVGYDVLRFDYHGTGDSSGECLECSLEQWEQDIGTAMEELQDMSGANRVSLVGLRLGATLAARVAQQQKVARLILWEPVVDGKAYLQDRIETDLEYETEIGHQDKLEHNLAADLPVGIMGFALSATMRQQLASVSIQAFENLNTERTYLLVREETEQTATLQKTLRQNPGKFGYQHIEHPGEWGEFDAIGSLLLPQATIQAVVACLL